jgi:hypothetical protein
MFDEEFIPLENQPFLSDGEVFKPQAVGIITGPSNNTVSSKPTTFCKDSTGFWGDDTYNQIYPNGVFSLANIQSIAAYNHTLIASSNGYVRAWGKSDKGQTIVPTFLQDGTFGASVVAAGKDFSVALLTNGTVCAWGDNTYGQCNVPSSIKKQSITYANNKNPVLAIACGDNHTIALLKDGSVIGWGYNYFNQTSLPYNIASYPKIFNIAAGGDNSALIFIDGTILIWGSNLNGNTIVPTGLNNVVQLSIKSSHVLALKSDSNVVAWGSNSFGQLNIPNLNIPNPSTNLVSKVKKVAAGLNYSLFLKYDGSILSVGDNTYHQLTVPNTVYQVSDIAAGQSHNCAIYCSVIPPPPPTPSITQTPSFTPTQTSTPNVTPTHTPTVTHTSTPKATPKATKATPTPTATIRFNTATPTPTVTVSKTSHPSPFRPPVTKPGFDQSVAPPPQNVAIEFITPTPRPTNTPTISQTATPYPTPTVTQTSVTPTPTPEKPNITPSVTQTVTPSVGSFKNCAYPAFTGLANPNNRYTTISVYKWDTCISSGNLNDGVYDTSRYFTPPVWKVDGHVTLVATTRTTGVVRESTGTFVKKFPLNSIQQISNIVNFANYMAISNDQFATSNIPNVGCNDPSGTLNFIYLTNDYSKNCVAFGVDGPVHGIYYDDTDNSIYAVGSFNTVNSNTRPQVAKFNFNGIYDPTFDVNQGYIGNPFNNTPNDIRRIVDSIYIASLQKKNANAPTLVFNAQNVGASHIHKVNGSGVKSVSFTPFLFTSNNYCIDYIAVPLQNTLMFLNQTQISFRDITFNLQTSTPINATNSIQGFVTPNILNPSSVYILQSTNGGVDAANKPKGIKSINVVSKTINTGVNARIGNGLSSIDTGGFASGALSPAGDFMILQRNYANGMVPGYWGSSNLDSPVFTKVFTTDFSTPQTTIEWNPYNNRIGNNGLNSKILIDSTGKIYVILLNSISYIFSGNTYQQYSIVRLFSDGTVDQSFNVMSKLNTSGKIYDAVLVSDNQLIICGDFTSYDGDATRQYIVKIDSNGLAV